MRILLASTILFLLFSTTAIADDWPQWRGPKRDGVWRERDILRRFPEDGLRRQWSVPIGPGYSGPVVADGYAYVTDRVVESEQKERVHCVDMINGKKLWTFEYPCQYVNIGYMAGPRACPIVDDSNVYTLGTMGNLHCLNAITGDKIWSRDLRKDFRIRMPHWGIAASPLIWRDYIILQIGGADGACVVALDKDSGEEVWRSLNDQASYSSPIMIEQAGRPTVLVWTGDSVAALDPHDGDVRWRYPWAPKDMPIGVATPVVQGDRAFFTSFYDGSLMLRIDPHEFRYEVLWQRMGRSENDTDALHSTISTPVFEGNYIYGIDSYGEFRCLDATNGDRIWADQTATPKARWSTVHFVKHGSRYFLFNERGELIIAKLSPEGFHEIDRAQIIQPTRDQLSRRGGVCWSHPAFADECIVARNDEELICISLED
ncbi:outer membrane protein assembly factor BamB family protein [Bremerella sp. T1]|uniref:outer membrane protein assembly factor BamB family protein n=1 Tax=Bremerella sp. TYQ1 TaxID=3119568 RepID=UPI001CCB74A4|nr:PQQ-binding-like beta-propeller repeat protein [Bremerella volcania]UBM35125.1 PQQ-like beta-propeller repeat protein [Bremerella volcania]